MRNEFEWAENFEQILKAPRHTVPRVVTVFKLPMSDDRKIGTKISPKEYLEMFVVDPGTITTELGGQGIVLGHEPGDVQCPVRLPSEHLGVAHPFR